MTVFVFGTLKVALGPYDVVQIHAKGPAFMYWLLQLLGKRNSVTVHGLDHQRAKWGGFASHYIICGDKTRFVLWMKSLFFHKGL